MEINNRIKELRDKLNLSQTVFGERIGVSRGVINNIDSHIVDASTKPLLIKQICKEYGVNEQWLRTGEGEMFSETRETYVDDLCQKLNIPDFAKRALLAYLDLSSEEQAAVEKYTYSLAEKQNTAYEEITCGELEDMKQSELETKEDVG